MPLEVIRDDNLSVAFVSQERKSRAIDGIGDRPNGAVREERVEPAGMRRAEHPLSVAHRRAVVLSRRPAGFPDGIQVIASGIALVIVRLLGFQKRQVQALLADKQSLRSPVRDVGNARRFELLDNAGSVLIAGGIIAQGVSDESAVKGGQVVVLINDGLGRPARGTEEKRIRGADSHQSPVHVVGGFASSPNIVSLHEGKNLESPSRMLVGAYGRLSLKIVRSGVGIPTTGRKVAKLVVVVVKGQSDLLQVILATETIGRLANFLDGRQEKPDEDADNARSSISVKAAPRTLRFK